MSKEQPNYISYLLRMWRANGEGKEVWRASLENPHTGERIGFASLDKLFAFLLQQAGVAPTRMTIEMSEQKSIKVAQTFGPEEEVKKD
jgi:Ser-tRNA(Ala) deacylase AlaX